MVDDHLLKGKNFLLSKDITWVGFGLREPGTTLKVFMNVISNNLFDLREVIFYIIICILFQVYSSIISRLKIQTFSGPNPKHETSKNNFASALY